MVKGEKETVAMWKEEWKVADHLSKQVANCLQRLARFYIGAPETTIIAASHSPTAETATPTPETTPRLGEADIVVYTLEVKNGEATILACEILKCPLP